MRGFSDLNNFELWVEINSPAINLSEVLIHELMHFWQFDNITCRDLDYTEGHSSFVELQYLHKLGQEKWADHIEARLKECEDNYGCGFRKLKQELIDNGEQNSFTYMKQLFGK